MKEFEIGGKITLEDNKQYRIVDIINEEGIDFYFCCTVDKNIEPKVLVKKELDGKVFIKEVTKPKIMKKVMLKMIK